MHTLQMTALIMMLAAPAFAQSACDYPHTFCRGSNMDDGVQTRLDELVRAKLNEHVVLIHPNESQAVSASDPRQPSQQIPFGRNASKP